MQHPISCSLPPGCNLYLGILMYPGTPVNQKIAGSWDLWKFIPPRYGNHRSWSIPFFCFHPADVLLMSCWGPQPQALWERFSSWSPVGLMYQGHENMSMHEKHGFVAFTLVTTSTAQGWSSLCTTSSPFFSRPAVSDQTSPATQGYAEGLEPPRYILTRIHYTRTRPSLLGDFQPFWSVFAKQSPMGCSALGGQGAGKPIQTFVQASACTFSPAPWSCGSCGTPKEQLNLQRTVCQE